MTEIRTWDRMRRQIVRQLETRTGAGVDEWNRRLSEHRFKDEASLRGWLAEAGLTGYPQNLLVWERFGYPDFITADEETLISGQYRDRDHLRPILDAVLAELPSFGHAAVQVRKGYVSLVTPRRTFAVVQATTRSRVDLGLRLPDLSASKRLRPGKGVGNETLGAKLELTSTDDFDDEAAALLRLAYDQNL